MKTWLQIWRAWHERRLGPRVAVKSLLLLLGVVLVLYPKLWLLPAELRRLADLEGVLDPGHPGLEDLEAEVRAKLTARMASNPNMVLAVVQNEVYKKIPYAWDWDTWGVLDYIPSVQEVLEKGREDCDGRAILAASLLRRMGYDARLVSDLVHVWVVTSEGETMSPGKGEKTIQSTSQGTVVKITPGAARNLGNSLAYGVGVFPLTRELILVLWLCALTLHPRCSVMRGVVGCGLMLVALGLIRLSSQWRTGVGADWLAWGALAMALAGWLTLAIKGAAARSPSTPARSRPGNTEAPC